MVLLATGGYAFLRPTGLPPNLAPPPGSYDVRILRDTWGVPHVFGRTDADVAYGLAWAHAEDDFPTLQGALLAARGKLAAAFGKDAAPSPDGRSDPGTHARSAYKNRDPQPRQPRLLLPRARA